MRAPTEFELERLMAHAYDPAKAHDYYEKHKHLKGRRPAASAEPPSRRTRAQLAKSARAKQRKQLAEQIQNLERKLQKLEALIRTKSQKEASEDRKSKAKKERAAKEKDKPKTAAEKAKIARENAQYRDKHKQKLKTDAKKRDDKSGGGSSSKSKSSGREPSVSELKSLAKKVRGQIAVAKQKLAAL